jgi:hypothetical protein
MSTTRLQLVTLATDDTPQLENFLNTASMYGYSVKIIGKGKKFLGWKWRTQQYIKALEQLGDINDVIILLDSNDIFFVRPSGELLEEFLQTGKNLIIGGEAYCVTGEFLEHSARKRIQDEMEQVLGTDYCKNRYRFPTGGFIMGYKEHVLSLLKDNQNEPDDQAGYLKRLVENPERMYVDYKQQFLGAFSRGTFATFR